MEIILKKDYKKSNGLIIKKGSLVNFTKELAQELIDKKAARTKNLIEKAVEKIKEVKEKATKDPENEETAMT